MELGIVKIIPLGFKKCRDCNIIKPLEDFYSHKSSVDGANSYCKTCDRIRRRDNSILKKENEEIPEVKEDAELNERKATGPA